MLCKSILASHQLRFLNATLLTVISSFHCIVSCNQCRLSVDTCFKCPFKVCILFVDKFFSYCYVIEMVSYMKKVAELNVELTVEERNLLSVAYKNVIGAQRSAWRIISSIEQKEETNKDSEKLPFIRQYRATVSWMSINCIL